MNRAATSLKRSGRYTLVWPILLGLLSFGDACVGQTPVENISGILRIVGAQYNVVETLAQQYAAVKDANGNQLAKPSTKVEEKTYEGNYAPPELRADLKGRFLYGLALLSDDGCTVTIDEIKEAHGRFRQGQALPNLAQSLRVVPALLEPGREVKIKVDYSNTYFITNAKEPDIDGVTLFVYLAPIEMDLSIAKSNDASSEMQPEDQGGAKPPHETDPGGQIIVPALPQTESELKRSKLTLKSNGPNTPPGTYELSAEGTLQQLAVYESPTGGTPITLPKTLSSAELSSLKTYYVGAQMPQNKTTPLSSETATLTLTYKPTLQLPKAPLIQDKVKVSLCPVDLDLSIAKSNTENSDMQPEDRNAPSPPHEMNPGGFLIVPAQPQSANELKRAKLTLKSTVSGTPPEGTYELTSQGSRQIAVYESATGGKPITLPKTLSSTELGTGKTYYVGIPLPKKNFLPLKPKTTTFNLSYKLAGLSTSSTSLSIQDKVKVSLLPVDVDLSIAKYNDPSSDMQPEDRGTPKPPHETDPGGLIIVPAQPQTESELKRSKITLKGLDTNPPDSTYELSAAGTLQNLAIYATPTGGTPIALPKTYSSTELGAGKTYYIGAQMPKNKTTPLTSESTTLTLSCILSGQPANSQPQPIEDKVKVSLMPAEMWVTDFATKSDAVPYVATTNAVPPKNLELCLKANKTSDKAKIEIELPSITDATMRSKMKWKVVVKPANTMVSEGVFGGAKPPYAELSLSSGSSVEDEILFEVQVGTDGASFTPAAKMDVRVVRDRLNWWFDPFSADANWRTAKPEPRADTGDYPAHKATAYKRESLQSVYEFFKENAPGIPPNFGSNASDAGQAKTRSWLKSDVTCFSQFHDKLKVLNGNNQLVDLLGISPIKLNQTLDLEGSAGRTNLQKILKHLVERQTKVTVSSSPLSNYTNQKGTWAKNAAVQLGDARLENYDLLAFWQKEGSMTVRASPEQIRAIPALGAPAPASENEAKVIFIAQVFWQNFGMDSLNPHFGAGADNRPDLSNLGTAVTHIQGQVDRLLGAGQGVSYFATLGATAIPATPGSYNVTFGEAFYTFTLKLLGRMILTDYWRTQGIVATYCSYNMGAGNFNSMVASLASPTYPDRARLGLDDWGWHYEVRIGEWANPPADWPANKPGIRPNATRFWYFREIFKNMTTP